MQKTFKQALSVLLAILLLVGAALYSVGKKLRYIHCVFHFFIDAGLAVFYWGIVTYVY